MEKTLNRLSCVAVHWRSLFYELVQSVYERTLPQLILGVEYAVSNLLSFTAAEHQSGFYHHKSRHI